MRALQIIDSGYRCTIEEQDDPGVWLTHALKGAGAELAVLLRGSAINYALEGQDASGLSFGAMKQMHPPCLDRDIAGLVEKGVSVFVAREDAEERGIDPAGLLNGVEPIAASEIPGLFAEYDQIWHW